MTEPTPPTPCAQPDAPGPHHADGKTCHPAPAPSGRPRGEPARVKRVPADRLPPRLTERPGSPPKFLLAARAESVEVGFSPPPSNLPDLGREYIECRGFLLQNGYFVEGLRLEESICYTQAGKMRELIFTVRPCRTHAEAGLVWAELTVFRGYFAALQRTAQAAQMAEAPKIILPGG